MGTPVRSIELNNHVAIPQLGFGVFRVPNEAVVHPVLTAIECGYRSIDTASLYGNEVGVGQAIATCGLPREDLFVTTKLWNDDQGYTSTFAAFEESLKRLSLEYIDLYLIHWPVPAKNTYVETWRAFEKLYADERVRAVGVSNFQIAHLQRVLDETEIVPAVNQVELHPAFQQEALRRFHLGHGIVTEAWSPLGEGRAMQYPVVQRIAARHNKTGAQIVLRWHLQLGNVVIPKSTTPSRIRENIEVFDFELTDAEVAALAGLDAGTRFGPDPDGADRSAKPGFSSAGGRWVDIPGTNDD